MKEEKKRKNKMEKEPITYKTIHFKPGWKNEFKDEWIKQKINALDMSGMSFSSIIKAAKRLDMDPKSIMEALAFKGLVLEKSLHVYGEITYDYDELDTNIVDASRNVGVVMKAIEKGMEERDIIFVEIIHESQDLSERTEHGCIKILK